MQNLGKVIGLQDQFNFFKERFELGYDDVPRNNWLKQEQDKLAEIVATYKKFIVPTEKYYKKLKHEFAEKYPADVHLLD